MSLKVKALSGMLWTYSQNFGSQLISFLVSIVLARFILPEEFGLIGMITIFIGIGNVLFEGGLTSSLIRTKVLDKEDYSTVFFFNLIGSFLIYFVLFLIAPLIAKFYNQPMLINVIRVYGLTFIFSAFGTVQNTILTRELKFKKQAMISLPALILSSLIGLFMAIQQFGVWSLVVMALGNSLLTSFLLWISADWRPAFMFNRDKFYQHFHYGYKLTLSGVLDILFTNIYQIIIGRFYAASQVGYYTRANSLLMLPVGNISGALNRVIFPLFSQVQDDLPRFRNAYKQVMQMVLFVITPIIVLMGILAKPLVIFLFTERWLSVVPIFQILCFTGILYPIHLYNLLVLQVKGRSDLFLKLEILKKVLQTLILGISFLYGFYALLWGQLLFSAIALLINIHFAGRMLNYSIMQQLKDIAPIFIYALIMCICTYIIDNLLINQYNMIRLIVGSLVGALTYLGLAYLTKFNSINDIKKLVLKNDTSN